MKENACGGGSLIHSFADGLRRQVTETCAKGYRRLDLVL